MKKYKVVTDNLDWYGLNKNDEITKTDNGYVVSKNAPGILPSCVIPIDDAVKLHPEWFKEIKEDIFSKQDMIDFAEEYHKINSGMLAITTESVFKEWSRNNKNEVNRDKE